MNHSSRSRRLPGMLLLAAAISASSLTASANDDLRRRLNVKQEAAEVVMGQVMYDFNRDRGFSALEQILLAKAQGRIGDDITAIEILLGDLYTSFNMPEAADNVFSRVASRDMRSQTRSLTWFRQAKLKYQQGNYFEAERALNVPVDTQITPLEAERRVMLANVLMARNEFTDARALLAPIPLDTQIGLYATYNMGVAHLRADRSPEGIALLEQVMNQPVSDAETNALKDRAALAIGYNYLQTQNPEKAREVLLNVRLEGPFSNAAMLALGYAQFQLQDYKRALSYWLELITRNPADTSVQEAMLLAPRAYEALRANQQAFTGYKLAAQTMREQLDLLERISADIQKPDWLDNLSPTSDGGTGADPLAIPSLVVPGNRDETTFLFRLFASHAFNEAFLQYQQLVRLRAHMENRQSDLMAMREVAAELRKRQSRVAGIEQQSEAIARRVGEINDRWPQLQRRVRLAGRDFRNFSASVSAQDATRQRKIFVMERSLQGQPDTPANRELRERVSRLKALLAVEIASRATLSQDQLYAEIAENETQLKLTQMRVKALQQAVADSRKAAAADQTARIRDLETRLDKTQKAIAASMEEHRVYLRHLASNMLEDARNRLNHDLAEAHLNIARLQDNALLREQNRMGERP
ncbi:MAG: tetratricopeptide repeat protein [Moraxellaceae bacterium]